MSVVNETSGWRLIPPEEKLELLEICQGAGLTAVGWMIFFSSILSLGYYQIWILVLAFLFAPLAYTVISNKEWNRLSCERTLLYLAARSAARRFAYALGSNDLEPKLLFRGILEEHYQHTVEPELVGEFPVWISLFQDCLVVIQEKKGGAILRFGTMIGPRLEIEKTTPNLILKLKDSPKFSYKIKSQFPVCIKAFEDMLVNKHNQVLEKLSVLENYKSKFNNAETWA